MRRAKELGLEFTVESMARALQSSKHDDMQILYDRAESVWVVRWHYDPSEWTLPEDEWGAVITSPILREALEEAVHGVYFS